MTLNGLTDKNEPVIGFWKQLATIDRRLLALDYDGTLAPFQVQRMDAYPLEGILPVLSEIRERPDTSMALISGRPVREVLQLTGDLGITIIGSHGRERRTPNGATVLHPPNSKEKAGLQKALNAARELVPKRKIETKIASVALHTRGLPDGQAEILETRIYSTWNALALPYGLDCRRFNGGIEVRAPGRSKGEALLELIESFESPPFPVYLGDDETDEDAFRILPEKGIGIRVGSRIRNTAAEGSLPNIEAVRDFLIAWANTPLGKQDGKP